MLLLTREEKAATTTVESIVANAKKPSHVGSTISLFRSHFIVSSAFFVSWLRLWPLFAFFVPVEGIIRNQRVILDDGSYPEISRIPHLGDDPPDEHVFMPRFRPRKSIASWRDELHYKALTFGQSEYEIHKVNFYVEKLKELADAEHPVRRTTTPLIEMEEPQHHLSDEITRELTKWNLRRMSDDHMSQKTKIVSPEEEGRFYEGDIVLTADQAKELYEQALGIRRRTKRKFIGSKVRRWDPSRPIYFSFDGSHTLREQKVIELALEHWHNITCLNFEKRSGEELKGNRIIFTDVDGCASNVGKHPLGEPQFVSLAPECIRLGVIAHEVAHALGFWHEQSRPDRDFFVQVQWENIDKDSKGQFTKEQPVDVDNGGVAYDYGSIMHYRSKAFAKYDDLFTLSTFISDYQRTIGQRDQLSFNDIRLMNEIYCQDTCPKKLLCQRGGYTDPRRCDRCRCPDGFTGVLCEQVMPGYGTSCGGRIELNSTWTKIASPGYPNDFKEGQECSWLLVAPVGQQVAFNFVNEFEMYCKVRHSLCMDYVEIRNSTDFANTGMRYCCYGTPKSTIISSTRDMLVLFRSFYRGGKGFMAQARAQEKSEGMFNEWSPWTECSASCGACGVRRRSRSCLLQPPNAFCLSDDTETEVCNRHPCRGFCTRNRYEEETTDCGGELFALLKNIRCKVLSERTRMEECEQVCCAGFFLNENDKLCSKTTGR